MTRYGLLHSYKMLDEVPVCSLAMGPSVGGGAIRMSNGGLNSREGEPFSPLTLYPDVLL